jgi:DNA-binding transcriptional ArsR family regulator
MIYHGTESGADREGTDVLMTAQKSGIALKAKLFRGLADPSRLSIIEALRGRTLTVGEIATATGLSQPNTSNHLACLRDCGLVTAEQRGRFVRYQLSDPRVDALLRLADELLADVARGVYECTRYEVPEPR